MSRTTTTGRRLDLERRSAPLFLAATLVVAAAGLAFTAEPASAAGPPTATLYPGSITLSVENNSSRDSNARHLRALAIVQHDAGDTVTAMRFSLRGAASSNCGAVSATCSGGYKSSGTAFGSGTVNFTVRDLPGGTANSVYSQVWIDIKPSTGADTWAGISGGTRVVLNNTAFFSFQAGAQTTTDVSQAYNATATTQSTGNQDFPVIYETTGSTDQVSVPADTANAVSFNYRCDDADTDFFSSDDNCDSGRVRFRNLQTNAVINLVCASSSGSGCETRSGPTNGFFNADDNTLRSYTYRSPAARGAYVIEFAGCNENGACPGGGSSSYGSGATFLGQPGNDWQNLGSFYVNPSAPAVSLSVSPTHVNTGATSATATATFSDADSGVQIVDWDTDANSGTGFDSGYDTRLSATNQPASPSLSSPQNQTITFGSLSAGQTATARARVYDNGAINATDPSVKSATASATFTMNTPPSTTGPSVTVKRGSPATNFTVSTSDPDGLAGGGTNFQDETLSFVSLPTAPVGTLSCSQTFTATSGVGGTLPCSYSAPLSAALQTISVPYTIQDSHNGTVSGTMSITITNALPSSVNDVASTSPNTAVDINVVANDFGDGLSLTVTAAGPAQSGSTVSIVGNQVRYTPPLNFSGYDLFGYAVDNGAGGTASALVQVYVTGTGGSLVPNNSMLRMTLGGTTPGSTPGGYDQIALTGPYVIGSQQLVISLRDGFAPSPGDTFDIITATSVSGAYPTIVGQVLADGVVLDVQYLPTGVRLVARQGYFVDSPADGVDASPGDATCATSSGACTIRAAAMEANAGGGGAIVLAPNNSYSLSVAGSGEDQAATGDIDLTGPTAVVGQGSSIDGGGLDRIFQVLPSAGTASFSTLTLTGGQAPSGAGAIQVDGGTVWLTDVTAGSNDGTAGGALGISGGGASVVRGSFTDNSATTGGAVSADAATLTVDRVSINANAASQTGGGIAVSGGGNLTVRSSTISANYGGTGGGVSVSAASTAAISFTTIGLNNAMTTGGGVWNDGTTSLTDARLTSNGALQGAGAFNGGVLDAVRVTFDQNLAIASGGGVWNAGATFTLTTSTISFNTAPTGSAVLTTAGTTTFNQSTIADNTTSGSGAAVDAPVGVAVSTKASIIANQASGIGCTRTLTTMGFNLGTDASCFVNNPTLKDAVVADALLGPLSYNGGYSPTYALRPGSPAINTGPKSCPRPDQRNWPKRGKACEKGSVEV